MLLHGGISASSTVSRSSLQAPSSNLVLPGSRPADSVAFESEMVAFFVDFAELVGVPKSVAATYGIIFSSVEPLSFSEISARLNFSSGSVSQAIKSLREIGAIRLADTAGNGGARGKTSERRSRDTFEPDMEMRRLIQRFIEQRLETQLNRGKAGLTELQEGASAYNTKDRKVIDQRLIKIKRWHERTPALLPVANTFLKLT